MPRCTACEKNYDDPAAMELVRNKDNRWLAVCKPCLDQGVNVNTLEPGLTPVDKEAIANADSPSVGIAPSGDAIADAKKLLEALRNLRRSKERIGRPRSHERRKVDLHVNYSLARDDIRHEGTVKDFSQGGLRIITTYPLTKGQIVRFDWNIPLPPSMARILQGTGEVRRVTKDKQGNYDVGFKFLARTSDKGANRRRFRRYKCNMLAFYQREGSNIMSSGQVVDISQGGCQINTDEPMNTNEVIWTRMIGGGGTKGDLVGNMRVRRSIQRPNTYIIGCSFDRMRMEPRLT